MLGLLWENFWGWRWRRCLSERLLFASRFQHNWCSYLGFWSFFHQSLASRSTIVVIENFKLLFRLRLRLLVTAICLVHFLNLGWFYLPSSIIWNLLAESIFILDIFSFNSTFPKVFFFYFLHFLLFLILYKVMLFNFLCDFFFEHIINLFYLFCIIIKALFGLHNTLLYIFSRVLDITFGPF